MNADPEINGKNEIQILIVEDSITQLTQLMIILENAGYRIATASNGLEALEMIEKVEPDLMMTDIHMPEIDGYELCSRVKSHPKFKDIPVILLTFMTDPQDIIKGLKVGADNFIPKPFSTDELLSRVDKLVHNIQPTSEDAESEALEVLFTGEKHTINNNKIQILDLLLSTFESAVEKNNELIRMNSDLRLMRIELEKKNSELKQLSEEKSRFVGMAAHDLRNPLGNIFSFSEILKKNLHDKVPEKQLHFIDIISNTANNMLNLVNELLDVSKIETAKIVSNKQEGDIIELLNDNIEKNRFLAEKKQIKISVDIQDQKLMLKLDGNRIDQVLDNLLSNAVKYSPEHSVITVKLDSSDENVAITVADAGVGIDSSEIDKIFEPFVSLSSQTTAGEPSTGLGLFTVKKIIDSHEGGIDVSSIVGKGTEVKFWLPLSHVQSS